MSGSLAAWSRCIRSSAASEVLAFRVSRVRCVMPLPTLGYSERLPPVRTSLTGVYAVSSAHIIQRDAERQ